MRSVLRFSVALFVVVSVDACCLRGEVGTAYAGPREPKDIGNEHVDCFGRESPWDLGLGRGGRYALLGTGGLVIAAVWVALRRRASRASRMLRTPRQVPPR